MGQRVVASQIRAAFVLYALGLLGVFLIVSPWTPIWGVAADGLLPAEIAEWLENGWLRGMVSALGVLDLLVALQAAFELWRGEPGN